VVVSAVVVVGMAEGRPLSRDTYSCSIRLDRSIE